jgi:hypothetical protein
MTREEIDQHLENMGINLLLMDGFDEAFVGYSQRIGEPDIAVYSYEQMLGVLVRRDEMDYDEATEYVNYNCLNAWIGPQTPIIVMPIEPLQNTPIESADW